MQLVEVCKEFNRNGSCEYSEKCKYAHPDEHVKMVPGEVRVCHEGLKSGQCKREKCKQYHAVGGQILKSSANLQVCKEFYYKKDCSRGENCFFAHPGLEVATPFFVELCVNFLIGKCDRENCKFYHDGEGRVDHGLCKNFPDCGRDPCPFSHPKGTIRRHHQQEIRPEPVFSSLTTSVRVDSSSECIDFVHGRCTRGSDCKFAHFGSLQENVLVADRATECIDFVHGKCTRGRDCKFAHFAEQPPIEYSKPIADRERECIDFVHNRCTRGSDCKFMHYNEEVGGIVADRERECIDFVHGRCTRGSDCKYVHVGVRTSGKTPKFDAPVAKKRRVEKPMHPSKRLTEQTERVEVDPANQCLDFLHNRCSRGQDCRFAHITPGGAEVTTASEVNPSRECLDFFYNRCTKGDTCKFSHNTVKGSGSRDYSNDKPDRRGRSRSPRNTKGGKQTSKMRPQMEICRNFLVGKCHGGCKFAHDKDAKCPENQRGRCNRGNECLLRHN